MSGIQLEWLRHDEELGENMTWWTAQLFFYERSPRTFQIQQMNKLNKCCTERRGNKQLLFTKALQLKLHYPKWSGDSCCTSRLILQLRKLRLASSLLIFVVTITDCTACVCLNLDIFNLEWVHAHLLYMNVRDQAVRQWGEQEFVEKTRLFIYSKICKTISITNLTTRPIKEVNKTELHSK